MTHRLFQEWRRRGVVLALAALPLLTWAQARIAPDLFIQQLGDELMARVLADPDLVKGDTPKIKALVDERVIPNMAFERMTASTVGPAWRNATPEQRQQLQDAFKTLLVRTYAGAVKHIAGKKLVVLPVRMVQGDTEVTVRSEIRSAGSEPVPLGYRLSAEGDRWMIHDINVVGIWLVETYRTQFAQQIQKSGVDGLIAALTRLNRGA
jgi:phospholipid transport system substrate-binding protein